MIISHRHRFVFFAVPKTGTHSIRRALRPQLADGDMEQVGLFVDKRFPYPELASLGHGHVSYRQIAPVLGAALDGYFKFAFVRNPFDRFVSYCAFMARDGEAFAQRPRDVMRFFIRDNPQLDHLLFRPQHEMLVDADGTPRMDFVGRSERSQADYDAICARVGIATAPLGQINATQHRHYAEYYDDELRGHVARFYARDLELFGYGFDA